MKRYKLNKKGIAFDTINKGMVSFIAFIFIVLTAILLVQVTKETNIVCPTTFEGDTCIECPTGFGYNGSGLGICCNSTSGGEDHCLGVNQTSSYPYSGSAYNATVEMQSAAALPSQFAQIVVIVIIIVGIIGMLTAIGIGTYLKMKK